MIDRIIQHYKITGRLGKGGMGEVYVAEDSKLDRRVALKILPAEMADDPVRLERFEREAKAIAILNHPNIVTIYSIEESEGIRFLTMELVEGETLHHAIPSKGMDIESFLRLSIPIAEALSAAHEKSIIHRDLKPANIMVSNEGRVKILDFGLAKLLLHDSDPNSSQLETRAKTEDGIVMGTMPYMSPEQVQGKRLDGRTDIFSMGIIFYEMITGQRPFQGDTSADLISSILRDTPSPVGEIKGQVPEHLERILRRCLAKDPRDRYQTARDVYNELRDVQRGSGPVSQTTSTASRIADTELWVAVLPFRSPGSDPDSEMLADGLTEDITIGLSRFSYLKVIAHHSTSLYKDKAIDVRKVGKELNARYILEGAIRKSGVAVRISAQLLDTSTGAHLWSDTYQVDLSATGIFDVQDKFAAKIASTIADTNGALTRSMAAVARTKSIESMSPYDALLRGLAYWLLMTPEEHMEVRAWLERAVEQSPDYADAWATLARMYSEEYKQGFNPRPDSLDRALAAARRAIELDAANHLGYEALAEVSFFRKDFGTFRTAAERAISLNPLDGNTLAFMGILACYAGDWENGVAMTDRAMVLNPHRPGWYLFAGFLNLYRQGEYERALEIAERVNMPSYYYSHMFLAAVNGQLGRNRAAQNAVRELLALVPDFPATVREELGGKWLSKNPDLFERLIDGLRKAGLEIPDTHGAAVSPRQAPVVETRLADSAADISAALPAVPADSDAVRAQPNAMWIAVLPFQHPKDPEMETFADGLSEDITGGLSQFSYLSVIAQNSTQRFKGQSGGITAVRDELGARYVMQGGIRKSGSLIRVNVQLIDAQSRTNLWAETYNRDLSDSDIFTIQDEITDQVVATVADNFGVLVRSMVASLEGKPDDELTANEYVLRWFGYEGGRLAPKEHAKIRATLEQGVERWPRNAEVWGCLAFVHFHEYVFKFNERPDSMDQTLVAAQRAVELNRASQIAYEALMWAYFIRGDVTAATSAAERAISLNPRNSHTLAVAGLVFVHTRSFERAVDITQKAIDLNPHHAGWFHFPIIWNYYVKGEYEQVLERAKRVNMPGFFWGPLAIASVCGELGRNAEATAAVNELLAINPDFATNARRYIDPWHKTSGFAEPLLEGLRKAGLDVTDTIGMEHATATTLPPTSPTQTQAGVDSDAVRAQPHAMWIAVLPFQHPKDPEMETFADGLSEDIAAGLSQFSYLSVVAYHSTLRFKGQSGSVTAVRDELGARYVVQGGIRKSGTLIRVNVQLIDVQTGTNLWAETYNRDLQEADIFATQDNITDRVVATVADGYGVLVRSMAAALEDKPEEELTAAEWVIRLYRYRQKLSPDEHAKIKESLKRAVERNSKQADVWACLCQIYVDEYAGFGQDTQPDSLERALAAGRRALDIDRTSQLGCQLIAQTHFFMRNIAAFRPAAEWAISLNARDSNTHAILGLMIAHTRDFEPAVELVRRAMEINPGHAGWYHFGLIWYHFQKQEYEKALEHANKVNMPGMFWTYLATAAINGLLGRQTEAAAAVKDLLRLDPDFAAKARPNVEAWHYASGLMDTILDGLQKAGLDIPESENEPRPDSKERSLSDPAASSASEHLDDLKSIEDSASALRPHLHNLPVAVSSFVGREQELAKLSKLLATQRLITITGAVGAGKSRIALEAAGQNLKNFENGVWQVDLAAVTADLVVQAIARAVGVKEESDQALLEGLTQHLKEQNLLLVLDNCEHVIEEAAVVIDSILQSAPGVRILATSREVFHLASEFVWTLPPLSLAISRGGITVESATRSDAVRLFVDRATARDSRFALTESNAESIAAICTRLDGIPLAIELAAARVKMMSAADILKRLEDCFRLLTVGSRTTPRRHQTMRAAVDWSYDLLSKEEQLLFRRLAVFRGGFDLEAAENTCGYDPILADQVMDLLLPLVDKSLVVSERSSSDQVRYRILEPLRQYAMEKLHAAGEDTAVARRHYEYFAAIAERAYQERIEKEAAWSDRLELDHDNFRAALTWASQQDPAGALKLAGALAWFWVFRSHFTEGRRWLRSVLAGPRLRTRETARALCGAGYLAAFQGDHGEQEPALEGIAIWREIGEKRELALALDSIGWHYLLSGNNPEARDAFEEAVRIFQELNDGRLVNHAKLGVCQLLVTELDVEQAEPLAEECLPVALQYDDPRDIHFALHFLADCALIRGDVTRAREKYADSLRAAVRVGDHLEMSFEVEGVAMALAGLGYDAKALRLKGAFEAELESLRVNISIPFWEQLRERYLSPAEKRMGAAAAAKEKQIGRSMGFEAAIEYALQPDSPPAG